MTTAPHTSARRNGLGSRAKCTRYCAFTSEAIRSSAVRNDCWQREAIFAVASNRSGGFDTVFEECVVCLLPKNDRQSDGGFHADFHGRAETVRLDARFAQQAFDRRRGDRDIA